MKTKKLTALILAIIMLFSVLPISVSAEDEVIPMSECMGQLTSGNTYSISNAEEFLIFENNNTDIYSKVKIILTNDITVNEGKFTLDENKNLLYNGKTIDETNMPVSFKPLESFGATFDGQGHTISGLYCSGETVGLFKKASKANINNLNIKNSAFIGTEVYAGSFVGECYGSTIKNCTSDAFVIGEYYVGGISGYGGEIISCLFNGTVIGEAIVGGVVGSSFGLIQDSGNTGTVYGDDYVGGFVGIILYPDGVNYCFNTGDVYGKYSSTGGFVGDINIPSDYRDGANQHLNSCYTSGTVHGDKAGNFFGTTSGDFSLFNLCYFVGDDDDTADYYGTIEKIYQDYVESVEPDPFGMGVIIMSIGIYSVSKEKLRNEDSSYYPFKISGFVRDLCNENGGYPLPKTLHKKHVWGEYVLNEADGTETAKCISDGCKATDTKKSGLNLNLWAQTNSDGSTLRFITCVDSLKYREVGFVITLADNPEKTITRSSKVVYTSIIANKQSLSAYDITGDENMKYILTFKITGLDGHQDQRFNVKPYVINLDGTTSYGAEKTFCTADMI